MINIKNKKILLIAPSFFDYEKKIQQELQNEGAIVYYIKENIDYQSACIRLYNRVFNNQELFTKYFKREINKFADIQFDYIFGIRINLFTPDLIEYLKEKFMKAKVVIYFWDSSSNMRNAVELAKNADKTFSFDLVDCLKYGWVHRPLFYVSDYESIRNCKHYEERNGVCMIATLTEERGILASHIGDILDEVSIQNEINLYMPDRLFYIRKIIAKEYKNFNKKYLVTKPFNADEIIHMLNKYSTVLDISHKSQSGLTMRTIEAIGAGKKIITNNPLVKKYDFYDCGRVFLYQNNDKDMVQFINQKSVEEIPDNIYARYSLKGWLEEIFASIN